VSPRKPLLLLASASLGLGLSLALATTANTARATAEVAARTTLQPFSVQAWAGLRAAPQAGQVLVFTTTDCAYCGAEVDRIAAQLRRLAAPRPRVSVVVMDGTEGARALLADGHYASADVVYPYDGNETALRYAIDPAWRGETPYLALVPAQGEPWFALGRASDRDLRRLLAARPRPAR
jgi:hypothetical protein